MANEQARVSMRPSTYTVGGGLIDDVDVTIKQARFTVGYGESGGNDGATATTLHLVLEDGNGTEHHQYFSMGNGFVPSETGDEETNGLYLVPVGEKTSINGGCNGALFMNSMVTAGLPEDLLDGDINAIEGTKMHVNRVPAPKRSGLPKRQGPNAEREQTIMLCTSIINLPGEASAPKKANANVPGKPQGQATTKPAAAKPTGGANAELVAELAGELFGIFAAKDLQEMKKVDIAKSLFTDLDKQNPNRAALIKLGASDDALRQLEGFEFDGKVLKLA